jgi:hypothetical protein
MHDLYLFEVGWKPQGRRALGREESSSDGEYRVSVVLEIERGLPLLREGAPEEMKNAYL